ncbi:MAG: hypothetical protein IKT06_02220 [Aeriscardovia sp.]|nr:hypothetical protein [Aeriscardovia sp.]
MEALRAEKWVIPVRSDESDAAFFIPTKSKIPTTSIGDILEITHCLLKAGQLIKIDSIVSPLWRKYIINLLTSNMLVPVSDTVFRSNGLSPYFHSPYPKPGGMYLAFVCSLKTQAPVKITSSSCRLIRSSSEVTESTMKAIREARGKYNAERMERLKSIKKRGLGGQKDANLR